MIEYVERKKIDWNYVTKMLGVSDALNQFSNFGPVSVILENKIHDYLSLDSNRGVLACSSGTSALHCLIEMHNYLSNKDLKWATCNFTFPCNTQGPLKNAILIPCDMTGQMPVDTLDNYDFDGLVLTDLFGMTEREPYREYCKSHNKILVVDSAMSFDKPRKHDDEIVSFHHTKPWGFGEGGCVIIPRQHEPLFRSIVNFGFVADQERIKQYSTNAKLSDIAAAFIMQRLKTLPETRQLMQIEYKRISRIAKSIGLECAECPAWTPACVPLIAKKPTSNLSNPYLVVKKYYKPLNDDRVAKDLYDRILIVPCHPDVAECSSKEIKKVLLGCIS